jgi:peptidoglycan/LPS O-acetylase OafA/YrhL
MWKRFTRLYPALLVFLAWAGFTNGLSRIVPGHEISWTLLHVFSIETWVPAFAGGTVPIGSVYNVSWSISTEIGMYLMFAAAMMLRVRLRPALLPVSGALCIALIIFLSMQFGESGIAPNRLAVIDPMTPKDWATWFFYQSPYFRVLQFAAGAAAAWASMRYGSIRIGRALATACVVALGALYVMRECPFSPVKVTWLGFGFEPLTAVLFAAVMFNAGDRDSLLNRLLSTRPLLMIGTISYSLYLFHPFITRMKMLSAGGPESFSPGLLPAYVFNFATTVFLAVAFAYGMYYLLERPAKDLLRKWAR